MAARPILPSTGLDSNVIIPTFFCQARFLPCHDAHIESRERLVVVLAFEGVQLLDVAGPVQTFASANEMAKEAGRTPYRIVVASRRGGPLATSAGLPLLTQPLASATRQAPIDTLILAGGPGVHAALKDARTIDWVRRQLSSARRITSVCTGAFLLAETGILAGRRATTHWKSCSRLQQLYPDVLVDPNPIYRARRAYLDLGGSHAESISA